MCMFWHVLNQNDKKCPKKTALLTTQIRNDKPNAIKLPKLQRMTTKYVGFSNVYRPKIFLRLICRQLLHIKLLGKNDIKACKLLSSTFFVHLLSSFKVCCAEDAAIISRGVAWMDSTRKRARAVGEDSDFSWLQKYLGKGLCPGSKGQSILKLFE